MTSDLPNGQPLNVEPPQPTHLRTALFDAHKACGGKIVPFAGWELPVQYAGVKVETLAVREKCGMFDVGHMGQLDVSGPGVTEALNAIVSADWSKTRVGRASYGLLLNDSGGIVDDVMGYRLAQDRWLVVVNASRVEVDEPLIRSLLPDTITLSNRRDNQAMIAVQGPEAEALLGEVGGADLSSFNFRDVREIEILGKPCVVARGGYTGCDGFEWMGDAQTATELWNALLAAGVVPAGLGARDVLRLEAGLPLYGHELRENLTPGESSVSFAVKLDKGDFHGRPALATLEGIPSAKTVRGLQMTGRGIAREGYAVTLAGESIGEITSGTPSPTIDKNIALAILPRDLPLGSEVEVQIRGTAHPAQIVALPFVPRSTKPAVKSS